MKKLSDEEVMRMVRKSWAGFEGDTTVLMSAIGALVLGREIGWKGVRVCLAAATYRKYERVLGIRFRDCLPERTKDSSRLCGIRMADQIGKFWQALSGGFIPALEGKMADGRE